MDSRPGRQLTISMLRISGLILQMVDILIYCGGSVCSEQLWNGCFSVLRELVGSLCCMQVQ